MNLRMEMPVQYKYSQMENNTKKMRENVKNSQKMRENVKNTKDHKK